MVNYGSAWRKWDLHIHSPATVLNNQFAGENEDAKWEAYLAAIEALGEVGVLGITDYFSTGGYRRVAKAVAAGRLVKVGLVMPNVELRILPVTGNEKAINIHVIACPTIVDDLDEVLLAGLTFQYAGNTYRCTREGLIALGRAFAGDQGLAETVAFKGGVEQFKVEYSQLRDVFQANKRLRQSSLIAVAQKSTDGNSGLQESGLLAVRQEIYRLSSMVLSANPKDRTYFLGQGVDSVPTVVKNYGSLKPCVHGCDAHSLEKVGKPDDDRHTWIKADCTFEGLRQTLFEPEWRVAIGPASPPIPIHRIRKVTIDLPEDAVLRWDSTEQPFCLRGTSELGFGAGLTCIIGGRGAGKSTFLNLLHEKLSQGRNPFWREHQLRAASGKALSISQAVTIDYAGDASTIEFVSQNEVEALALDPSRLTVAIDSRLAALDDSGKLIEAKRQADDAVRSGHGRVRLLLERQQVEDDIVDRKGRLAGCIEMINCFADPEYVSTSERLQAAVAKRAQLAEDREALAAFVVGLYEAIARYRELADAIANGSKYRESGQQLAATVETAMASASAGQDLSEPGGDEIELETRAAELRASLSTFLKSRGLSAENLSDVASASEQKSVLEKELRSLEQRQERLAAELKDLSRVGEARKSVETCLQHLLTGVNGQFSGGQAEARRIELRYRFDVGAAEDAAIEWLIGDLGTVMPQAKVRVDHAKSVLEKAGSILGVSDDDLTKAVNQDETKTGQTLDLYFAQPPRLEVWRSVRERLAADVNQYMRLDVLYDGKRLEQTSFGQRCSAVLVVLLSLGNRPIIVDEPEAHLDSSIVATFMVDLVKRAKLNRQIIFATHNANFVVNGDAELVHVLIPDQDGRTAVRSATIEDLKARDLLLNLEGGERAFRQREGRYGLGL